MLASKDLSHRIMSIDVNLDEFDRLGNLTSIGKDNFWKEVDRAIKKFDRGSIKLLPRKFQPLNAKHTDSNSKSRDEGKSQLSFLNKVAKQYEENERPRHSPKA